MRFKNLFTKTKKVRIHKDNSLDQTEKTLSSVIGGVARTIIIHLSLPIVVPILIGCLTVALIVIIFMQIISYPAVVFGVGTDSTNYCNEDPSQVEYAYEPLEGGLAIPHYRQQDERWGSIRMWDVDHWHWTNIRAYGCSTTCMAMLASYYNDRSIYPDEVSVAIGGR